MNFLNPGFLWALTALSIPIIVHLFNFRRTTRVYFSSNRFLKHVQEVTTAKRRLKHYLILASRLLFLLLLVLAFAQPVIPAREQLGSMRNMVIYLDNSLSMSVPVEDKTRALEAGVAMAQTILQVMPPDTRYRLITNDFAPFSNSYKARAEIADLLTQIRYSPVSRSATEITDRIRTTTGESAQDVFWISDFQQSTLGSFSAGLDSLTQWHLVPLQFTTTTNVFCDSAFLENPFVVGGERNTLHVRLRNTGDRAVDQLLVKLTINDVQAGTSAVSMPPQGTAEASFDLTTGLQGISRAVITFNDFPVSFDNEFYMALNFSEKINVLEIKSRAGTTPVERVYGNQNMFVMRSFTVSNVNYSLLPEADLVVLTELDRMDEGLSQALRTYVQAGGTLLVIPAASPDVTSYRNALSLPNLAVEEAAQRTALERPDFDNPFFENVFEERSTRINMPEAMPILTWGADRSAILAFKNEKPFLSLFRQHEGNVYLLASPLQPSLSSFASNALFVPVMYRIAASGKKQELQPYYKLTDPQIIMGLDTVPGEQPLRLVGNEEIVPAQRKMSDKVILELPRFNMSTGFYHVLDQRDTVGLLAFNLDNRESLLQQFTGNSLRETLAGAKNVSFFEANGADAFSNEIKARYLGTPLWKYAVMAALFFLLAEILLIRFLK